MDKPLKRRMKIKRERGNWSWINFKYERLSTFCFVCGISGHAEKDCAVVYANPDKEIEKAYGPWLRAQTRNAQMNSGAIWLRNSTVPATEQGSGERFRAEETSEADITGKFVNIDGIISEKGGNESGITIKSVPAADKKGVGQI